MTNRTIERSGGRLERLATGVVMAAKIGCGFGAINRRTLFRSAYPPSAFAKGSTPGQGYFDGNDWCRYRADSPTSPPTASPSRQQSRLSRHALVGLLLVVIVVMIMSNRCGSGATSTFSTTRASNPTHVSLYALSGTVVAPSPPPPTDPNPDQSENLPSASPSGVMQAGLYSWGEFDGYVPQLQAMSAPIHRIGGPMDDSTFAASLKVGAKILWTANPFGDNPWTPENEIAMIDQGLSRYGPGGTYWHDHPDAPQNPIEAVEILNEPNGWTLGGQAEGDDEQNAWLYAQILIASYAHIKSKWPSVTVVGFSCMEVEAFMSKWTPLVFAADPRVAQSFDVFSWHPYAIGDTTPDGVPVPPDQWIVEGWGRYRLDNEINTIQNLFASYGIPNKPLWITETGYKIGKAEGGAKSQGGTVTLTQQAAYNLRMDILAARWGCSRVYHMYINDDYGNWGFYDGSKDPRPTVTATKFLNTMLAGSTSTKVVSEDFGGGGPFVYSFTTPNGTAIAAWAQTPQPTQIALNGTTTVYDMLGNVIDTTTDGTYQANLGETPIWLITSDVAQSS